MSYIRLLEYLPSSELTDVAVEIADIDVSVTFELVLTICETVVVDGDSSETSGTFFRFLIRARKQKQQMKLTKTAAEMTDAII